MSSLPHSPSVSGTALLGEQRLFLRKKVPTPIPIELFPGKEVWLDNLGEGGLRISGSSRLDLGTVTFLAFQFPEANSVIEAAGVIAWCDDSGRAGVRFTRVKPDSSAALKRWLKSGAPATDAQTATTTSFEQTVGTSRTRNDIAEVEAEIASKQLATDAALNLIAERMLRLTRSGGAAVAWRQGEDVICQASAGNAPSVGVKISVDASLTGECYRTGNIVMLADSESDIRVDAGLCRQLEFRSLLILPIVSQGATSGIVEVFSPIPGNFEGGDTLLLSSFADLLADVYEFEQERAVRRVHVVFDIPNYGSPGVTINESVTGPLLEAPIETPNIAFPEIARGNVYDSSIDSRQVNPVAEEQWLPQTIFSELSHSEPKWEGARPILITLLLLIAAAAGLGDYFDWHFKSVPGAPAEQTTNQIQPRVETFPGVSPETSKTTEQGSAEKSLEPQKMPPASAVAATVKVARHDEIVRSDFAKQSMAPSRTVETAPVAPALAPPDSLGSRVAKDLPAMGTSARLEQKNGVDPFLATKVTPGKLIHRVNPVLPEAAKNGGMRGSIVVSATIGKDGRLRNLRLLRGSDALASAAFRALREWRYTPYLVDGRPVEADTQIVMDFHP